MKLSERIVNHAVGSLSLAALSFKSLTEVSFDLVVLGQKEPEEGFEPSA